ncbi:MAG TPA: 3-dehydroquinate synthase [Gemmataceae bacterium]|jgi:3-dehydroquinate synthase|nr:3-dehydroquinate synthase [Gemmataceae bacterium]
MTTVRVNLGPHSYDITVTSGDAKGLGPFARQRARGQRALVVTDERVRPHAEASALALGGSGFETTVVVMPPGESQKSLAAASDLYDCLADAHADRQTLVVAVGGGVIGDLAGFVAATYTRGLPLLMVPTTLLAMVDSAVGGKVGVNHPKAKNLIGAFHQPVGVWIDTATLETLPDREYRSGLAEVVKYGVILDPELFGYLEDHTDAVLRREAGAVRHVVGRCCRLKADIVERDEREESGLRMVLNYGHTFAHAFETAAGYGGWLHGEAVAAGMVCASRLAERHGLIPAELTQRQERLLAEFGLPTRPGTWPAADLLATMRSDKKTLAGRLRFVLPRRLGEVVLCDDIPEAEVVGVLKEARNHP